MISNKIAKEKIKNLETERLSKTNVEANLSKKVKELEKKVDEVESKEQTMRTFAAQKLEEAQLAEKQLAIKVEEFDQLSSTVNESASKKLEDEYISLKEQIAKEMGYELVDHRLELFGRKLPDNKS